MPNTCTIKDKSLMFDILAEMFNIGIGKSASLLSEIINKKILLDISRFNIFFDCDLNEKNIEKFLSKVTDGTLMVSSIEFEKKITGEANLIFPMDKMRAFINLCLNQESVVCENENNFTDVDIDIIKEIGNIVLNALIGEISNFLNVSLNYSLPKVRFFCKDFFKLKIENKKDSCIILLYVTFIIDETDIQGAIIVNLNLNSLKELMRIIKKMEDELYA